MSAIKRICTGAPKIGTHSGTFHCDEALACFMLRLLPKYKDARIIRSRDKDVLNDCDVVVDVGGVYDPESDRFDHHQRGFNHSLNSLNPVYEFTTKLSSAGLVYYHFGIPVIREVLNNSHGDSKTLVDNSTAEELFVKIYRSFIQEIDAIDNGISTHDGESRYNINSGVSSRIGYLNPPWNCEKSEEEVAELFVKAMDLVGSEFIDRINHFAHVWLPARSLVELAIKRRFEIHNSGRIIFLERFCTWRDHLFGLEKSLGVMDPLLYIVFQNKEGSYGVICVPIDSDSFENRRSLPEGWRGMRDDVLSGVSGIPGCVFVHANGFIGANKTYEGAIAMAEKSLSDL